jgi:hypothetical protein
VRHRAERLDLLVALLIGVAVGAFLLWPSMCRADESGSPSCTWTTEDLDCQPADELTAEQMDDLQAHAEAALRLTACQVDTNDPRCRVLDASLRLTPPDWALFPMAWVRWTTSADVDAFLARAETEFDYAIGRRSNPFAADEAVEPFEVAP